MVAGVAWGIPVNRNTHFSGQPKEAIMEELESVKDLLHSFENNIQTILASQPDPTHDIPMLDDVVGAPAAVAAEPVLELAADDLEALVMPPDDGTLGPRLEALVDAVVKEHTTALKSSLLSRLQALLTDADATR
jgi:hypothetical protein